MPLDFPSRPLGPVTIRWRVENNRFISHVSFELPFYKRDGIINDPPNRCAAKIRVGTVFSSPGDGWFRGVHMCDHATCTRERQSSRPCVRK